MKAVKREQPFGKKGRKPREGTRFPSQVVGDNVRVLRGMRKLRQMDLSERMQKLGHESWSRVTVSDVERASRAVSVDELFSLALSLHTTVLALLDPAGVSMEQRNAGLSFGVAIGEESDDPYFAPELAREYIARQQDPWSHTPDVAIAWENNEPMMFLQYENVAAVADTPGLGKLPRGARFGKRIGQPTEEP